MSHQQVSGSPIFDGAPVLTRDKLVLVFNGGSNSGFVQIGARVLNNDNILVDVNQRANIGLSPSNLEVVIPLTNGRLSSLQISPAVAGIEHGRLYVEAYLAFGSGSNVQRYASILSGYLSDFLSLAWPTVNSNPPGSGPGRNITDSVIDPGVGADLFWTLTAGIRRKFQTFSFWIDTDANVANRGATLTIVDPSGDSIYKAPVILVQTASTTFYYNYGVSLPVMSSATDGVVMGPLPTLTADGEYEIWVQVANIQAGDQIYSARLNDIEWSAF